jgi:hypothetical protein
MPDKTTPFAQWTAAQQWMPEFRDDPRSDHGYSSNAGMLLLADELGDKFSELGRASLIQKCFRTIDVDTKALMAWALCGPDVKALDMKKLEKELDGEKVAGEAKADVLQTVKEALEKANKIGALIDGAAKDDPGVQQVLKLADTAKAEWTAYLSKNKAAFDQYLVLKDAVRTGKSNNPAFKDCYAQTQPAFEKHVKALAKKIPWDVGNDYIPGYMRYLTATTEGYITTVSWAACAWGHDKSGESPYSGAAAGDYGGAFKAGWRTIALGKALDPNFKPKYADRNMPALDTFQWKYGVQPAGTSVVAPIVTRNEGVIGKLTKKDDDYTTVSFKGDKVESCLQWADTNRVSSVDSSGGVHYDKKCLKRGMIDNQVGASDVPTRYLTGAKVGDTFAEVNKFPVVAWKAKKLTMLFGVKL